MAIVVDYTPVGGLGGLAQQAGKNQAAQISFMNALRQQEADRAERALKQSQTAQLLQYVLQKKALTESSRRFDLSRKDQQAQFASSMSARSASIRQSREQSTQAFSIQQAARAYQDREQAFKMATAMTPEQKQAMDLQEYLIQKQIDMGAKLQYHQATTQTPEQKQAMDLQSYTAKQQIAQQYKTPADSRPMKQTGVVETAESKRYATQIASYDYQIRQTMNNISALVPYDSPENPTVASQIKAAQQELGKLHTDRKTALDSRTVELQRVQDENEALRKGYNARNYNRLTPGGKQPPRGPVSQQASGVGVVAQIKQRYASENRGEPTVSQLVAELKTQYPNITPDEAIQLLRDAGYK